MAVSVLYCRYELRTNSLDNLYPYPERVVCIRVGVLQVSINQKVAWGVKEAEIS
jgi:hypothetical protein